jgi:DNA-binding MarR family transcriptional regulator
VRQAHPTNRRCKVISLTDDGREVVATIDGIDDPAPPPFAALDQSELETLQAILAKLSVQ